METPEGVPSREGHDPEQAAARPPTIGWVVDVQNDFMLPPEAGGRLYVSDLFDDSDPGARVAAPRIEAAVRWMRDHCDVLVFTGDWHGYEDGEIDPEHPDPEAGTYPPHCMGRSHDPAEQEGAEVIESIRPVDPLILDIGATTDEAREVARRAVAEGKPVFVRKNRFDVFAGNPAAAEFVRFLERELGANPVVYVAGVARDVCVTQAIDGLQARGYETVAIRDATWGLGLETEEQTLSRWRRGGRVVCLEDLQAEAGLTT